MLLKERERFTLKQKVEWVNRQMCVEEKLPCRRTTTLGVKGCAVENSC